MIYSICLFQVTVIDHCERSVTKMLPSCTSIHDLKKRKLFNGGQEKYSPDLFILSYNHKALDVNKTLDDLFSPGMEVLLRISSINIVLRHYHTSGEKKLALNVHDMREMSSVVARYLGFEYGIHESQVILCHGDSWYYYSKKFLPLPFPGQEISWFWE